MTKIPISAAKARKVITSLGVREDYRLFGLGRNALQVVPVRIVAFGTFLLLGVEFFQQLRRQRGFVCGHFLEFPFAGLFVESAHVGFDFLLLSAVAVLAAFALGAYAVGVRAAIGRLFIPDVASRLWAEQAIACQHEDSDGQNDEQYVFECHEDWIS